MADSLPPVTAEGFAYAAGTSQRQPARLVLHPSGFVELHGAAGALLARVPRDRLQADAPLGSAPRKLGFPDGTLFETTDHIAFLAITGQTRGSLLHKYEAFRGHLVGVVALCLLATWALWRYGLDILVAVAIWATPPAIIAQMDVGTLRVLDFQWAEPSALLPEQKAEAEAIFVRLRAALPPDVQEKTRFTLLFRDMPGMGPNAFALPGGTIVLTDTFVTEFPQADVLAGVLGHEMGHVVDQHGLKRLYRSLSVAVLIAFLAGDVGPILEDVVLEGNLLLQLSHSRAQEREADAFGLGLAANAGYDPAGLAMFFEQIAQDYGDQGDMDWLSTHPSSAQRVRDIEGFIEKLERP